MVWSAHTEAPNSRRTATKIIDPRVNASIETFEVVAAVDMLIKPDVIPDQPGVYGIMLDGGEDLLRQCGLPPSPEKEAWQELGCDLIYAGEAGGLRTRILDHLTGDVDRSTLRQSLAALEWSARLPAEPRTLPAIEAGLAKPLRDKAVIAFKVCALPARWRRSFSDDIRVL